MKIEAYLFFPGNAGAAMDFYQTVFGGKLTVTLVGDANPNAPEAEKNNVINASLETDEICFRASDDMGIDAATQKRVALSIMGKDDATLRSIFDMLADGGSDIRPLAKEFWGDIFGVVTDKFGISWQVVISPAE